MTENLEWLQSIETKFRLYAKFPGQKTFKPLDLAEGIQTDKLIYATLLTFGEGVRAIQAIKETNPEVELDLRPLTRPQATSQQAF